MNLKYVIYFSVHPMFFLSSFDDFVHYTCLLAQIILGIRQSSECLLDIESSILDINIEIKGYISKHTDDLMSGMQDFALLAERYSNLSSVSQKLHRNVEQLRKEV